MTVMPRQHYAYVKLKSYQLLQHESFRGPRGNAVPSVKQEGWLSPTERASVAAISLRHILASPRYAPGTVAVNVT